MEKQHRPIRSYVIREGRMTPGQRRALEEDWPKYGLETEQGFLVLKEIFPAGKVVLEIGFGMGDSLHEMALANPDINYIGAEVHRPGVGHLLSQARESGLDNLKVFAEDSIDVLSKSIPEESLDGVQIFFPDPWHKKKHHKRRLINPEFVKLIATRLKAGGVLHIATDWSEYAESIQETMASWPKAPVPARVETKYERRGRRLDHDVFDFAYRKPA